MPIVPGVQTKTIESYKVYHSAVGSISEIYVSPYLPEKEMESWIELYDDKINRFGTLCFWKQINIPEKSLVVQFVQDGRYPRDFLLNYEISRYQDIIDTLRYERPIEVSIAWDDQGKISRGNIRTSRPERTGELETVPE